MRYTSKEFYVIVKDCTLQKATYKISNPKLPRPVNFKPCKINCGICGRTYATEGALAKHMKMHEDPQGENTFKCKVNF